jgi:nitronate monooxygenase
MISSRITELLEIEHPILSAPMAGVAGGGMAAAVSRAGGFGLLGGGYGERDWMDYELSQVDCSSIGIGFITWRLAQQPELLELALDHAPKAIFLSFGDIQGFASRIKRSKSLLIAQVQSLNDAQAAAAFGADIVVAQGTEAGGHGATRATLPLVPAVVDAIDPVPVVAAGGIADGRGLAAALMLGAAGVLMGTRFYCSRESLAPTAAVARALSASGDDTTRTSVFDVLREYDWPPPYNLRTLSNHLTARYGVDMETLQTDKLTQISGYNEAVANADYDKAAVIVGEALDLIDDVPAAADIIQKTIDEACATLQYAPNFELRA